MFKINSLIVQFKFKNRIDNDIIIDKQDYLSLQPEDKLEQVFNRYLTKNGITFYRNKIKNFYLFKNNEYILLNKKLSIQELGLISGDVIEVRNRDETIQTNVDNVYSIKHRRSIKNKKPFNKLFWFLIGLTITLSLILVGLLLYFFVFKKKKKINEEKELYLEEPLVTKMSYSPDVLYRYQSNKKTNMIVEGFDISEENGLQSVNQYIDFIFMIRNKFFEIENNTIKKNWYSGYIGILNITINNGTDDINIFYDKNLTNYLNEIDGINNNNLNLRILDENHTSNYSLINNKEAEDNETLSSCFIKIEFYENGDIKNIYIPEIFTSSSNMVFIENIIKLIIPKLSPNLYVNNITDKINALNNNDINDDENEYEIETEDNKDTKYINLEEEKENNDKYLNRESNEDFNGKEGHLNENSKRRLQNINENEATDDNIDNLEEKEDTNIEDYTVSKSDSEGTNIDLRECNHINDSLNNYTNITQFSYQQLENDDMSLKDSELNTVIYSNINENGILYSITEQQTAILNQPDKNDEEELKKKEEKLKNDIYNSNNEISLEEADFDNNIFNNMTFNISKISMESLNEISLTIKYNNDKLKRELFKYFDNFEYSIYNNKSKENQSKLRILNNEKEIKNKDQKKYDKIVSKNKLLKKRKLGNKEYYGMKNFIFTRDFFDYNLLGLALKGSAVCEMEPSTGVVTNYFDLGMSIFNKRFKLANQQTNLHIILEKMNKMTYGFISLLYQSNKNLEDNNIFYGDVIIDIEKNVSQLFEKYFDYSGIFTESLNNLYSQVSNFTGQFLSDLIKLIDDCHYNYTLIYIKGYNDSYEFINKIREITKESYIGYINNMINNLYIFNNETLKFLKEIEEETNKIDIFQIDLLYDIIDLIYDAEIIFKQFNQKLFRAIEKGILTFKYDIKDYIESIIGDLLYLTDFLSINLNKNEILRKSIESNQRNITIQKLKDFRNIILEIMNLMINKIYIDYDNEMMTTNSNSIKFLSENAVNIFINDIEYNTNKTSELIKTKIKYINLYEMYSDNINTINLILKKAGEDFNNDVYNKIIKNISLIIPEFLNKENSNLIKTKNLLFNLTQKLSLTINNDINDINNNMISMSNKYIEENLYYLHYNIYNFRKSFMDNSLNNLFNDFISIVENNMKINYINLIDENYNLMTQYLNEENNLLNRIGTNEVYLGSEFIKRYNNFLVYSKEFMALSFSDEFMNDLEKYFYEIKNAIYNYIDKKMKSIKKYNFNDEIIKNNFYLLEKIYEEIYVLTDNLNKFFNQNNFILKIKLFAMNIGTDIIKVYDEEKGKILSNLYDNINKRVNNRAYGTSKDLAHIYWVKKRKWYGKKKWVQEIDKFNCGSRNNINKINKDLSKIKANISKQLNELINNYINTFTPYLSEYINYSQNLYTNIYNYYQNEINNNQNVNNIMNKYNQAFDDIMNNINNYIIKNDAFKFEEEFGICLYNLEKNINEIENNYYKKKYLNNYEEFLEYPYEIKFKTNKYKTELKNNVKIIKTKINNSYQQKINNILKETKIFIQDIHEFNYQYIIENLNNFNPNVEYYNIKKKVIKENFILYTNILNEKLNQMKINEENKNIISNYENNLLKIENNYSNFVSEFDEIIEKNFTFEKCRTISNINSDSDLFSDLDIKSSNIINSDLTDLIECWREEKQSDLNYSKYNFNTVKIRTEIYFMKTLIEKIDNILDDINYNDIINSNKLKEYDEITNDKNIIEINKETKNLLKEIQKENLFLLEETFELFTNSLKHYITLDNEIQPFFNIFEEIIKNINKNYTSYVNEYNDKVINEISIIFNDFKTIFNKQINLKKNYDAFNIKKEKFNEIYEKYNKDIENNFNIYKEKINKLKTNEIFYNSLKLIIRKFEKEKGILFKEKFNEYSKKLNYQYEFYGYIFNIGEQIETFLENEFYQYEYDLKYKYFELFENNANIYINKIIQIISEQENILKNNLKEKYSEFLCEFEKGSDTIIDDNYYNEYQNNCSKCEEYKGKYLIDLIKQDLLENNYTEEIINNIFSECSFDINNILFINIKRENNTDTINVDNDEISNTVISDIEESNIFDEYRYNCSEINENIEYNHVKQYLICEENNYFNLSIIIFEDFTQDNKKELDKLISDINLEINKNYLDEKFFYEYVKNNIYFEIEEIPVDNFDIYLENIYEITTYINNYKDNEYKKFLNDLLVNSFNLSYNNIVNKYIVGEMIDNITIIINNKLELYLNYIYEKISNEYLYYIFILNKTNEIGLSTKSSLINLFTNFKERIIESIYNIIENDVNFYIDIFYRENKNIFTKEFINYFTENVYEKKYNISIYKLKDYISELIYDKSFNKTLDNISYTLIKNITEEMKLKVNIIIGTKISELYSSLNKYSENLENILSEKETVNINEEMLPIFNIIQEFDSIVKNQNNSFNFKVNQEPFNLMEDFIEEELRPPLLLIHEYYDFIEEQIIDFISDIVDDFPDCYSLVRDNFIDNKIDNVNNYIKDINDIILEYKDEINDDIEQYINKLSFYTFINGLNAPDKPCDQEFCLLNNSRVKTKKRRLNSIKIKNNTNINFNFEHNKKNINKKEKTWKKNKKILFGERKLEEYDSSNPSLSEEDVLEYIDDIKKTILNFDKIYLKQDYQYITTAVNIYLIKINGTCLDNLKRSFNIKLQKFSTLLTEEKMNNTRTKILTQYNQIEPFIHERSNFIKELITNFTEILNNTKELNQYISEHIYEKSSLYYTLLTDNIQSKYKIISLSGLRNLVDFQNMSYYKYAEKYLGYFEESIQTLNSYLVKVDEYLYNLENKVVSYVQDKFENIKNKILEPFSSLSFGKSKIIEKAKDILKSVKSIFNHKMSKTFEVEIPLPIFPCLYLTISTTLELKSHLDIKPDLKDKIALISDLYAQGEIIVGVDVGIYIPKGKGTGVSISVSAGLNGVLASGRVGLKLSLYLLEERYETDLYFIFNAFSFEFYVKFSIRIEVWRFKKTFTFYIIRYFLKSLITIEKHKIKSHDLKLFNLGAKFLLKDKIKDVLKLANKSN